jgi:hypothetical protein
MTYDSIEKLVAKMYLIINLVTDPTLSDAEIKRRVAIEADQVIRNLLEKKYN